MDEIIILPESALTAWQLCILAYKLSSKGAKRLQQIRICSTSTILPQYHEVDESTLIIEAANVDRLSVENETSVGNIERMTQYMNIGVLTLKVSNDCVGWFCLQ